MNLRTQALAIFMVLFIGGSIFYYSSIYEPPGDIDKDEKPRIFADVDIGFTIDEQIVDRGEFYKASLDITTNTSITLNNLTLAIIDNEYGRKGTQWIKFNETIEEGNNELNFEISPAFPDGRGAVISVIDGSYSLLSYEIHFNTTEFDFINQTLNIDLSISDPAVYDQGNDFDWNITSNGASIAAQGGNITVSSPISTNFQIATFINGTGYPLIEVDEEISNPGDDITYVLNSTVLPEIGGELRIGNYLGLLNFTILGSITAGETIKLNLTMLTKAVTIFAVIADNNFAAPSGENFEFRDPGFYVSLMSFQFEQTFNITIIPAISVDVDSPDNSTLSAYAQDTIDTVGRTLSLDQDSWFVGTGSYAENHGYDVLLIFTNDTMDNLGVVYGNAGGAFNLAMHARGSLNTGNYRLPPSFADNLIQHEVSHIFGAPDRFTSSDPPSIMTKSEPDDAINDIIFGKFWLYQIKWLEEDIQTMIERTRNIYWS